MTVIAAPHSTPTYTLNDLKELYKEPVMNGYMVCLVLMMVSFALTLRRIGYGNEEDTGSDGNAGGSNPQGEQRTNGQSFETIGEDWEMRRIICFGGLAGSFGGCSVLLAKSTAELVKNALFENGADAFRHSMVPYIIIALMLCCLLTQITILNKGLSRFNALLMVPVYQSFWNGSSVLGGIIYFQEYRDLNALASGFFVLGISVTMGGVVYLLRERRKEGSAKKGVAKYKKLMEDIDEDFEDSSGNESDDDLGFNNVEAGANGNDKIEMSDFNRAVILGGGGGVGADEEYGDGVMIDRYNRVGGGKPRSRTNSTDV